MKVYSVWFALLLLLSSCLEISDKQKGIGNSFLNEPELVLEIKPGNIPSFINTQTRIHLQIKNKKYQHKKNNYF